MTNQSRFYLPGVEVRVATTGDSTSRTLTGVLPYHSFSSGLPWQEQILPGAFAEALKIGSDVLLVKDHDVTSVLGRQKAGNLQLTDSASGLQFRCVLPNTQLANDIIESINAGLVGGLSFGFVARSDKWQEDDAGTLTRDLLAVDLIEISVVSSWPAYDTSVSVRSVPAEYRSRFKIETRENENGCDCACPDCESGMCDECSDEFCVDPNCLDCPNQDDWEDRTRIRIEIARRQ